MLNLNSPIKTPYHRLPVVWKLAILSITTIVVYQLENHLILVVLLLAMFLLNLMPGINFLKLAIRNLSPIIPFMVFILLWHVFTGSTVQGMVLLVKFMIVISLANLVTMTSQLDEMIALIEKLVKPLGKIGLDLSFLGLTFGLVIRSVPNLLEITRRLNFSWRSRSLKRPGWRLIFPLICFALDDADHVAEAIKARRSNNG
ncbi:MAG: energy-coupling factor transporter transmembrane protein EcfT [Rhodobacteraceae bacterium]|nr:energy-coupling factor transporter transmembrane protein EcfT [Paracoccaceae bacterium]MCY4249050.1 energy-coupling factor transporter transmembrane protein EcfT [Paracoccaceae bacterium]